MKRLPAVAPVLIMAGGTGGHVFPALAVARALLRQEQSVVWLGSERGLENQIVPREGIPLESIRIRGLRRRGLIGLVASPIELVLAVASALAILWRRRPRVVLGMGGFASGPGGLAAWLLRRPLIIHEQNAVAGLTNRLLAGLAREVLEAFPGSFSPRVHSRWVGNPVRDDIVALPDPRVRLGSRTGRLRVLVLGGSQGAQALNEVIAQAMALIPEPTRPDIWHQAGATTFEIARCAYVAADVRVRLDAFIDDMAAAYAWADVVICRAGALTISELMAAGLGAILIPYPLAADDHQSRNAQYLVGVGAATVLFQADATPRRVADELLAFASDRSMITERACRARAMARPNAARELAERCMALGGRG